MCEAELDDGHTGVGDDLHPRHLLLVLEPLQMGLGLGLGSGVWGLVCVVGKLRGRPMDVVASPSPPSRF